MEDAINAKNKEEGSESSCGIVSRFYRKGICDITGEHESGDFEYCFKHLSILSLCFLFVCSQMEVRPVNGSRLKVSGKVPT